jgi:excisionase family DNA binding protein
MLTKQEAADRLGVSIRAIENYSSKGKLHPQYTAGQRGKVALFDEAEVERLKDERGEIVYSPKSNTALATMPGQLSVLANLISDAIQQKDSAPERSASVGEKILLDLKDCHILTGLSDGHLRAAIKEKKLKGKILGKSYRIKRTDLDSYIKKL